MASHGIWCETDFVHPQYFNQQSATFWGVDSDHLCGKRPTSGGFLSKVLRRTAGMAMVGSLHSNSMAVGQNQWDPILGWVNSPLILVYFSGDRDVHWWYGPLTRGHVYVCVSFWFSVSFKPTPERVPSKMVHPHGARSVWVGTLAVCSISFSFCGWDDAALGCTSLLRRARSLGE